MRIFSAVAAALTLSTAMMLAHVPVHAAAAGIKGAQLVEFERMTWPEVKAALAAGKTTALIYTGGVEERGPQNANGGHNQMAYGAKRDSPEGEQHG
jgi:creatinine amidohydrolase